jgi:hypothetical protein
MSLTLFENITEQLTDAEKEKFVPMLIDTLSYTHPEHRMIGKNICGWFKASGCEVSEIRLRKMINYIRVLNLIPGKVLIGAGNGYYLTDDPKIVEDQIESIQGRIDSMAAVVDSLKAQLVSMKHKKTA